MLKLLKYSHEEGSYEFLDDLKASKLYNLRNLQQFTQICQHRAKYEAPRENRYITVPTVPTYQN